MSQVRILSSRPFGTVAQLEERRPVKAEVAGSEPVGTAIRECDNDGELWLAVTQLPLCLVGSNPITPTTLAPLVELAYTLRSDRRLDRASGFESREEYQQFTNTDSAY
jgi:hypothetical protein